MKDKAKRPRFSSLWRFSWPGMKEKPDDGRSSNALSIMSRLGIPDQVCKSTAKDGESLRAMQLINPFPSWDKRSLSRFPGMGADEHLQGYLDWFAYLFRIKRQAGRELSEK